MNKKKWDFTEKESGTLTFENEHFYLQFSSKSENLERVANINFVRQVHGTEIYKVTTVNEASSCWLSEADALYTDQLNLKIGLYTADCVPCFIILRDRVFALHLGWRSLCYGLLNKVLQKISLIESGYLFIGPHISFSSFEVQRDTLQEFQKHFSDWTEDSFVKEEGGFKISLSQLIINATAPYKNIDVFDVQKDTFTDPDYFSYRKEGPFLERNFSFAFLK